MWEIKKTDYESLDNKEEIVRTVSSLQTEIDEAVDYLEKYVKIQSQNLSVYIPLFNILLVKL